MDCRAACVFLRCLLIFLYHTVPCLSKTSHDLAPGDATALGTALGSFATKAQAHLPSLLPVKSVILCDSVSP